LKANDKLVTFADFDPIFDNINGDIAKVGLYRHYDANADTTQFDAYYKKMIQEGVFDTQRDYCYTDNAYYWSCEKIDGGYKYLWMVDYQNVNGQDVFQVEQRKEINIR
jgi:hypothetical protein